MLLGSNHFQIQLYLRLRPQIPGLNWAKANKVVFFKTIVSKCFANEKSCPFVVSGSLNDGPKREDNKPDKPTQAPFESQSMANDLQGCQYRLGVHACKNVLLMVFYSRATHLSI